MIKNLNLNVVVKVIKDDIERKIMKIFKSLFILLLLIGLVNPVYAAGEVGQQLDKVIVEVIYKSAEVNLDNMLLDDGTHLGDYSYQVVYPRQRINTTLGKYFTSVAWVTKSEGTTLSLNPNFYVRWDVATNNTAWSALSNPLFGIGGSATFANNYNKFYNQYLCHFALAKIKTYWNLDAWRPDVDIQAVYDRQCNP